MRMRRLPAALASGLLGIALSAGLVLAPTAASADPDAVKDAQKKVAKLHEEGAAVDLEAARLAKKLQEADKKLALLERDVTRQRAKVASMRKDMGQLALAQYQQSGVSLTAKLLTSTDDTRLLSRLSTVQSETARTNARLQLLQAEQGRLTGLERDLAATRDQVAADHRKQADLSAQYAKKIDEADAVLARLTKEEKARLQKLREQEAARQLAATRKADAEREAQQAGQDATNQTATNQSGGQDTQKSQDPSKGKGGSTPAASSGAAAAVAFARAQVGKAYVMGAEGPDAYDCSGLTMAAWRQAGVSLPRTSSEQAGVGVQVSLADIQPGDLVIFYSGASHVGIYVGGGMLVDAANPRKGVRLISLSNSWMPIHSIRRVG